MVGAQTSVLTALVTPYLSRRRDLAHERSGEPIRPQWCWNSSGPPP